MSPGSFICGQQQRQSLRCGKTQGSMKLRRKVRYLTGPSISVGMLWFSSVSCIVRCSQKKSADGHPQALKTAEIINRDNNSHWGKVIVPGLRADTALKNVLSFPKLFQYRNLFPFVVSEGHIYLQNCTALHCFKAEVNFWKFVSSVQLEYYRKYLIPYCFNLIASF